MNGSYFVRGMFTIGMGQVLTWGVGGVLTVLMPRSLGDAGLGKLMFALALTSVFGLIAEFGASSYLAREVARDPARAGVLTANALALRVPLTLLASLVAIFVVGVGGHDEMTRNIVYVLCLGIFLTAVDAVVRGTIQGLKEMKPLAASTVASKVGYSASAIPLLLMGAGPLALAVASLARPFFSLAVTLPSLLRQVRLVPQLRRDTVKVVLVGGAPFFVWQGAVNVYGKVDAVLLAFLTNDSVVGWYVAGYGLMLLTLFATSTVTTVVFPALSAAANDPREFSAIARRSVLVVQLATVPMAIGMFVLARPIIDLLGYPASFVNSVPVMMILAFQLPLVGMDMVLATCLNARDRERQWASAGVAAAVLNPLLNLAAIPITHSSFGNGGIGAAIVTVLTELFMFSMALRFLPRGVLPRQTISDVAKVFAAGAAMGAVVWVARDVPFLAVVPLGAVVYFGSCLAIGAISIGDLKQVRMHLLQPRRPAAVTG